MKRLARFLTFMLLVALALLLGLFIPALAINWLLGLFGWNFGFWKCVLIWVVIDLIIAPSFHAASKK